MSDEENVVISKYQRNVDITNKAKNEEAREMENLQTKSLSRYFQPCPV